MFTTTNKEFCGLHCDAKRVYRDAVARYNRFLEVGRDHTWDQVEELGLYLDALGTWDQDKFTYLSHVNTMNDYDIRAIFTRVKQLLNSL